MRAAALSVCSFAGSLSARSRIQFWCVVVSAIVLTGCSGRGDSQPDRIDFNAHIRPIFNSSCVTCHGGVKAASGVSFIYREDALGAGESGRPAIVAGRPNRSELIARITSTDPDYRMPHVDHGPPLSPEEIALFRQWIREGAEWSEHWAFVPPAPQTPPEIADPAWNRTAIDRFVRARLDREGLTPSPRADKATLLRRVSFDLTGLPPTPEDVAAFEADSSPNSYERQVDRLLSSQAYGERWASLWLDLARYADTKGYESDGDRTVWPYRDWLVDALNRNQPYDAFMIDQLAGDLIPSATLAQRIATTFHRNTQTNDEGGTDDEEFRTAAVLDRVSTTWQVLNGVTFACVQCHSHPYDPIRHEEFYRFMAFFNSSRDADQDHEYPHLRVPDDRTRNDEANALQLELASLRRQVAETSRVLASDTAWQPSPVTSATARPEVGFEINNGEAKAVGTVATRAEFTVNAAVPDDVSRLTAIRLDVLPLDPERAAHTPEQGFFVSRVTASLVAPDGLETRVSITRFVTDEEQTPAAPYYKPVNQPRSPGTPARPITPFTFTAMPSLDRQRWTVAVLPEPIDVVPGTTLRIALAHGREIGYRPAPVRRLRVAVSSDAKWIAFAQDPEDEVRRRRIDELIVTLADMPGVYLPVMSEMPANERRQTRLFARGNWLDKTGPALEPDVPALFPPLPDGEPRNRLTLARWFFGPEQPLTARAAVNRYWQQLFGTGLVATLEDYGSVGEAPSHPELLDWLARHFQFDLQWDMKALLRAIVTSETYMQRATVDATLHARDPDNRLLARGPRTRLTAEMVRDQALHASGLLSTKMYGPPVMPYQPDGVWATVYNPRQWTTSSGEDRYRRALYTFWKRTSVYPSFITFDAPSRDACTLRREPTNTPLQALVLLNDPVYDEAARALAARMRREAGDAAGPEVWIARGWQLLFGRPPADAELSPLLRLYEDALPLVEARPDRRSAALAAVASALFNLDAALTK